MYSLLFLALFFGCYLLYITSKKAKLGNVPPVLLRFAQQPYRVKAAVAVAFVLCWIVVVLDQGLGSGTFAFGGYVMTMLCVIILLNPLKYLHWRHVICLYILSILMETFIF